ncbi:MAG: TonB-dependent receptor [Bryobacterales bacterium]|nr:TonB-dependent receptor [Bryobacterales bacterium]
MLAVKRIAAIALLLPGLPAPVLPQSTQALISGRVYNRDMGFGIAGAMITATHNASGLRQRAVTGAFGYFWLTSLSAGTYSITVTAQGYQPRAAFDVTLFTAGFLTLDFPMRTLSAAVWHEEYMPGYLPYTDAIVHIYAADVATTAAEPLSALKSRQGVAEASQSYVIAPEEIGRLPLTVRDLYTTVALQPGVTSQPASARGLGLSANGQRPTSSNFLLDGVQINDPLVTGPLTLMAPEAVQEYRVSVGTSSAEYGGAAGLIANAVSKAGTNDWHSLAYWNMRHDALNAQDYEQKRLSYSKPPLREMQEGFLAGGPLSPGRVFGSLAFDAVRFRSRRDPVLYWLPSTSFLASLPGGSAAGRLLRQYPALAVPSAAAGMAQIKLAPKASINRYLAAPRADAILGGGVHHIMSRAAIARLHQPDLLYSPYEQFNAPYNQNLLNVAGAWTWSVAPRLTNELRAGYGKLEADVDRPHPQVPVLLAPRVTLPGAQSFYAFQTEAGSAEVSNTTALALGRHLFKWGGFYLNRRIDNFTSMGRDGIYYFDSLDDFAAGNSSALLGSVARGLEVLSEPGYRRHYGYGNAALFAQDSFRPHPRLTLSYGLRYKHFGTPKSLRDATDFLVAWGQGNDVLEQLRGAQPVRRGGEHDMFDGQPHRWAVRFGIAHEILPRRGTVLRAGYGIFYDRIFDNLWLSAATNAVAFGFWHFDRPVDVLLPLSFNKAMAADFAPTDLLDYVAFAPRLSAGRAHNFFASVQQPLTRSVWVEATGAGSLGRGLVTTDRINRYGSVPRTPDNLEQRIAPGLPQLAYRANQGDSDYFAGTALVRFRASNVTGQMAYTLSHMIDVQSDPIADDYLDLNWFRRAQTAAPRPVPSFTRQFRPGLDRANSDFDQRHNLVFFAAFDVPRVERVKWLAWDWRISLLGAVRSGTPYTVYVSAPGTGEVIVNNRPDLIAPATVRDGSSMNGGRRLLNPSAFQFPADGQVGSTGRNAFAGPGQFSFDFSIARRLPFRFGDRSCAVTLRADLYNALNHANLGNPLNATLPHPQFQSPNDSEFAVARYGRRGRVAGVPLLVPLTETARQIQLLLRLEF